MVKQEKSLFKKGRGRLTSLRTSERDWCLEAIGVEDKGQVLSIITPTHGR